mmetsp:Transcript_8923/g.22523  ORF Transcript_8923/g.22523 Transcript_8923/m.22523 type:complete len:103 (+) Transcript_8923:188-496(+)|eukprot:1159697-Pelagomonas_calceolata.AAC.1
MSRLQNRMSAAVIIPLFLQHELQLVGLNCPGCLQSGNRNDELLKLIFGVPCKLQTHASFAEARALGYFSLLFLPCLVCSGTGRGLLSLLFLYALCGAAQAGA